MEIKVNENQVKVDGNKLVISITNEMRAQLGIGKISLSSLKAGDKFMSNAGIKYIVCEQFLDGTTAVCRNDALDQTMKFGENNNYNDSNWDKYLEGEYLKETEHDFGTENICEREVNLLSLDGYDDYGVINRKISPMDIDQFRKYHKFIGDVNIPTVLVTPNSTPSGWSASYVQGVGSNGDVDCRGCDWHDCGVRPSCILKSSIFVSPVVE